MKPYIAIKDEQDGIACCIPNFCGDDYSSEFLPDGYEIVEELFVDNSGYCTDDGAALTQKQFIAKVKKGFGYAITGIGQFQVWIGVFKKKE